MEHEPRPPGGARPSLALEQLPLVTRGGGHVVRVWGPFPQGAAVRTVYGGVQTEGARVPNGCLYHDLIVAPADGATRATLRVEVRAPADTPARRSEAEIEIRPVRRWEIHLLPHSHVDYGYTNYQETVLRDHIDYLERVLALCRATDHLPVDARYHWNCEVLDTLLRFLASEVPESDKRELLERIREGRIGVNPLFVHLTQAVSGEQQIRMLYRARRLCRERGIAMRCAATTDVNGFSWGLASVLAEFGVRYLDVSANPTRGNHVYGIPRAFRWEAQDGRTLFVWNGENYLWANTLGLAESFDTARRKLPEYLNDLRDEGFPYAVLGLRIQGERGDNRPPTPGVCEIVRQWNECYQHPQLTLSTFDRFCERLEREAGSSAPTLRGDWTDWWTDGVTSCAAETAISRRAKALLEKVEKLAAWLWAHGTPSIGARECEEVYTSLLYYDEHTYGAFESVDEPYSVKTEGMFTWKRKHAYDGWFGAERLRRSLYRALDPNVSLDAHVEMHVGLGLTNNVRFAAGRPLLAFNPLPWDRSDMLRLILRAPDASPIRVVERASGATVPHRQESYKSGARIVEFLASAPATGCAAYDIVEESGHAPPGTRSEEPSVLPAGPAVIENETFRLTVMPDGLVGLVDKRTGYELVERTSPYPFNGYIYERTPTGRDSLRNDSFNPYVRRAERLLRGRLSDADDAPAGRIPPRFERSGATVRVASVARDTVMERIVLEGSSAHTPRLVQTYTLYRGLERLDIENTFTKEETLEPESAFFCFPFSVRGPCVYFDTANALVRVEEEQLPGACRDWHPVGRMVYLHGQAGRPTEAGDPGAEDRGINVVFVPLDAPMVHVGAINTGRWAERLEVTNGRLYSWVIGNHWYTNFRATQGGEMSFRYAVLTFAGGLDRARAYRLAAAAWNRFEALPVAEEGTLGAREPTVGHALARRSFFRLESSGPERSSVAVEHYKVSEDGEGILLRLRELGGRQAAVLLTVDTFAGASGMRAFATDCAEDVRGELEMRQGAIVVPLAPFALVHVKVVRS